MMIDSPHSETIGRAQELVEHYYLGVIAGTDCGSIGASLTDRIEKRSLVPSLDLFYIIDWLESLDRLKKKPATAISESDFLRCIGYYHGQHLDKKVLLREHVDGSIREQLDYCDARDRADAFWKGLVLYNIDRQEEQ